jgi:hypothetical protein
MSQLRQRLTRLLSIAVQAIVALILTLGGVPLLWFTVLFAWRNTKKNWFDTMCDSIVLLLLGFGILYVAWRLWRTLLSPADTRLLPAGFYSFWVPKGHILVPIDSPSDLSAELLLFDAATRHADKITFGEPADDLPRKERTPPSTARLTDKENKLIREADAMLAEPIPVPPWPQTECDLPGGKIPVWMRLNQQWEPQVPLPINLLPHLVQSFERVLAVGFNPNDQDRALVLRQAPSLPVRVRATLRMEKNCCYSVTLHYLDAK